VSRCRLSSFVAHLWSPSTPFTADSFSLSLGAAPGSRLKSPALIWANFVIMLFGNVVTDGVVGWLVSSKRTFKERYVITPSLEWSRMKTRAFGFRPAAVIILGLTAVMCMPIYFRAIGCTTAFMGDEKEWSVTSCPVVPTDITQMLKVGESWQGEWQAATVN